VGWGLDNVFNFGKNNKKTNKQTNENINKINKNKAKQGKTKIYNCDVSYFLVYPL